MSTLISSCLQGQQAMTSAGAHDAHECSHLYRLPLRQLRPLLQQRHATAPEQRAPPLGMLPSRRRCTRGGGRRLRAVGARAARGRRQRLRRRQPRPQGCVAVRVRRLRRDVFTSQSGKRSMMMMMALVGHEFANTTGRLRSCRRPGDQMCGGSVCPSVFIGTSSKKSQVDLAWVKRRCVRV